MEVVEITNTKLVFLLDKNDTEKYHITDAEPSLKDGYLRLITDSGTDPAFLSDVLVQIFELKNGGCEMFVTKLSDDGNGCYDGAFEKKDHIYVFNRLQDMLAALNMLKTAEVSGGRAYIDTRDGSYYLAISKDNRYIGEFLGKKCKNAIPEYLTEHCTLICNDAVGRLSQFI